jgi:hypothetical protein
LKGCNVGVADGGSYGVFEIGSRWQDIHIKFHDNLFRYLNNIIIITTIFERLKIVLLIKEIDEICRCNGLMWHDKHTKFHED